MTGLLYGLGHACARWRFVVLGLWLVLVVALVIGARGAGSETTNNVTLPGTGSQSATDLLSDRFPSQAYGSNPLVVATDSGKLTDSKYSKAIDSSVSALKKTPHVTAAVSPLSDAGAGALSKDKQIGYISVALDVGQGSITEDEANAVLDAANPAKKAGLQVAIGGYVGQELSKPDTGASDKIGIFAAMVILLLVFGSAVAMGLPILTAVLGLLCGLSVVTLLSHVADVPTTAPTLATMIGLAVGIDYSLFIVTKHRTQVNQGMEVRESIARATATAGGAVLFAGGTVAISLLALAVADIPLVTTLGYTSAIAVAFAILAALTLLPALFGLLGSHVSALTLPFRKKRANEVQSPAWTSLATWIANHRWPVMVAVLVALLALSIPTLSMRLGQEDVGAEPTDTTARQAYDLITEGFGAGTNGPFLISARLSQPAKPDQKNLNEINENEKKLQQQQQQIEQEALLEGATQQQAEEEAKQQTQKQSNELANKKKQAEQPATDPRLQTLKKDLGKAQGVKSVSEPLVNKKGTAAVYTLIPTTSPSDLDTEDLVTRLRDTTIPNATKGQGMTAFVGGTTASYVDLADKITNKLPLVILVVAALSFLVLLVGFRSLVLPTQAAVMNLISVGAAYGVLTLVFQEGFATSLIGLDGAIPVVSFVPLIMFAILFGLSTDYQVFLLTQIQEHFKEGKRARATVIEGLGYSGRIIGAAALVMFCVFGSFVLNGDPTIKQFGLGLATAVAIDAIVVCLFVPALITVAGRATIWLPRWLDRVLPHISIEGAGYFDAERPPGGPPAPAPEPVARA
ncbi:MAG: MMPL family transporter [Thermoleophilaceae bacterium]|nr:MMPL family transporter [Thermoleophilaceae bacterium]